MKTRIRIVEIETDDGDAIAAAIGHVVMPTAPALPSPQPGTEERGPGSLPDEDGEDREPDRPSPTSPVQESKKGRPGYCRRCGNHVRSKAHKEAHNPSSPNHRCPRCAKGTLVTRQGLDGPETTCLQCGHEAPA